MMILKNLWRRRTRTFLTLAGIAIGVAAVIVLSAFGEGMASGFGRVSTSASADLTVAQKEALLIMMGTIDESVGEQMWDRDSVSRALLNLIDNAIKYSADDKKIEVVLRQNDEHVIIEVKDHGIGISASDLTKVFDPYFRAQFSDTITRRGAGLGLTLVQQILASHGGKVEVESATGNGSTFRLLFPRDLGGEAAGIPALGAPREAF